MKFRIILIILFLICFISGISSLNNSLTAEQENVEQKELETYLKTAKAAPIQKGVGGRGENWIVSLDDGKTQQRGFFKLSNRYRPHSVPDSYRYGISAYELNKLLDLNLVPPTVEREIEGRKGSLVIFFRDAIRERDRRRRKMEPPNPEIFKKTLDELKAFENLAYSSALCEEGGDDLGDILILPNEGWKVWRVDFSEAFFPIPELIPYCEITRCSKKLYQNLLKLDDKVVKAQLEKYLNDEEMNALLVRKKLIIERIQQLIKEKGEDSVLFQL